jgi:hypothetical protein
MHADLARRCNNTVRVLTAVWLAALPVCQDAAAADAAVHWAFRAPRAPRLPRVQARDWPRNAIDYFVLARLEVEGLRPSSPADRATLARRAAITLTGLPPSPAQLRAFLADPAPDAYERLVDRLLESPAYGEHAARYWLDAARYGDTHGLQMDNMRSIWPYRDWVIQALNDNLPFDRFTVWQLAGDLLPGATAAQRVATGFQRCNVSTNENGAIPAEFRARYAIDRVSTMGTVWLGLTTGCAACHDHKYDPLSQTEFYRLVAFYNSVAEKGLNEDALAPPPAIKVPTRLQEAKHRRLQSLLATASEETGAKRDVLRQLRRLEAAFPWTMVMRDLSRPRDTHVLLGGRYDRPGRQVEPGVPAVLPPLPPEAPRNRLALARWLVDPAHPLTARVTVNRIWQQHFGTGLVRTSEDFGTRSQPPSHPALLDFLATAFLHCGWDLKAMHRAVVTSATFRQSSRCTPRLRERDPANRLLARGPRFRLDAEVIRDVALAWSGLLVGELGGPSVRPYQPAGLWEAVSYPSSSTAHYRRDRGRALYRRSLYTFWKRTAPPPALQLLDAPTRETCVVRRLRSNTPTAALVLLNDVQFVEAARGMARRTRRQGGSTQDQVRFAFLLVTARDPTAAELEILLDLLDRYRQAYRRDPTAAAQLLDVGDLDSDGVRDDVIAAAWTMLASTLLNLAETIHQH